MSPDGGRLAKPAQQYDPRPSPSPGADTLYYEDGDGAVRRFSVDVDDPAQLAR